MFTYVVVEPLFMESPIAHAAEETGEHDSESHFCSIEHRHTVILESTEIYIAPGLEAPLHDSALFTPLEEPIRSIFHPPIFA